MRDNDIHTAANVATLFNGLSDQFILTGSYSIEALTGGEVRHNDVDANIFTDDISHCMERTREQLQGMSALRLAKVSDTRLEYRTTSSPDERNLELQFVRITGSTVTLDTMVFDLDANKDRPVSVPTVLRSLEDSTGTPFEFRVKSLPYAIATWGLRISGFVAAQKRAVRQTDIDHFAFLLNGAYKADDVLAAIDKHPQMSNQYTAHQVWARIWELYGEGIVQ